MAIIGSRMAARSLPVRWPAQAQISIYRGSPREHYCSISFNVAPCVTRYHLAEILISAGPRFDCYIQLFFGR